MAALLCICEFLLRQGLQIAVKLFKVLQYLIHRRITVLDVVIWKILVPAPR